MQSIRKLAAIMFADIVGYTVMMQEDEAKAKQARDRHRQVIRDTTSKYSGEVIQYYGDGALVTFPSAIESVIAGIEIQQSLQAEPNVPVRIGIHLGEVVQDSEGIFGDSVNIASRIESMAIPGAVLFSERVYQEIANHPEIKTTSLGAFSFKNVNEPVSLYSIKHKGIPVPQTKELKSAKGRSLSKSIAIMPFANMVASDESDYFAEGISEEIISGLSTIDGIDVISRSTCTAIKHSQEDYLNMGRRLKVSYFLEGSVRRAANRVRVSVQLVNTNDGYQLWAESYDRLLDDIFEVQDEIARKVINKLKVSFKVASSETAIVAKSTEHIEAYTHHLKGMHYLKKGNPVEAKKAIVHFEKALKIDPGFSSAECALSQSYSYLGSCGALPPVSAYAKALKCAMNAIDKSGDFAGGHLAMANIKFYHFWDWDGARRSLEKAQSLGLNSADFYHSFGLYYAAIGKPEEGIPMMLKALELDPLSVPIMNMLGTLYLFDEQFEKAIWQYDEILDLEPGFRGAHQYKGISLACLNRYQEALKEFEVYHHAVNHPDKAIIGLIISYHHLGEGEIAKKYLDRLYHRMKSDYSAAVEIDLAIAHAGTGDYDTAVNFLESVYEKRLSIACMGMIWVMRCPYFKKFWAHPGYKNLMGKMGFT